MDVDEDVQVNLANALDLSESEDEEELEDIIDDFAAANMGDDVRLAPENTSSRIFMLSPPGLAFSTRTPLLLPIPHPVPDLRAKSICLVRA